MHSSPTRVKHQVHVLNGELSLVFRSLWIKPKTPVTNGHIIVYCLYRIVATMGVHFPTTRALLRVLGTLRRVRHARGATGGLLPLTRRVGS